MPRTLAMAAVLVAAMVFSASASLALSLASSCLRAFSDFGVEAVAGLVGERLRAVAGVGQRLLVGRKRRVGLLLQAGRPRRGRRRCGCRARSMMPPMRGERSFAR